jgi:hypothetical protein
MKNINKITIQKKLDLNHLSVEKLKVNDLKNNIHIKIIMSSVVAALDPLDQSQYNIGENNRLQYNWSDDIKQQIVQLHFQLVRDPPYTGEKDRFTAVDKFEEIYKKIYVNAFNNYDKIGEVSLLNVLHRLVAFTRDIVEGKGEYMLSYDLVYRISKYNVIMAQRIVYFFVNNLTHAYNSSYPHESYQAYGSWKDIKYMWNNFEWSNTMRQ